MRNIPSQEGKELLITYQNLPKRMIRNEAQVEPIHFSTVEDNSVTKTIFATDTSTCDL